MATFAERVIDEWLPAFCSDPKRNYDVRGFDSTSIKVEENDAADFLRAVDCGLVEDRGGVRLYAPRSPAAEFLFYEHGKGISPRRITLWLEPVIGIAALARLHLDHGWPKACLGLQSKAPWAFDFVAYDHLPSERERIAGEVKKTAKELAALSTQLAEICAAGDAYVPTPSTKNSFNKYLGLARSDAGLFWAVGPSRLQQLFAVSRRTGNRVTLEQVNDPGRLNYTQQ